MRNSYKIISGKCEGMSPFGKPGNRWENNIEMGLKEIGFENVDWFQLA
jgi:hypothetical protein